MAYLAGDTLGMRQLSDEELKKEAVKLAKLAEQREGNGDSEVKEAIKSNPAYDVAGNKKWC
jgi:hypothetical protein